MPLTHRAKASGDDGGVDPSLVFARGERAALTSYASRTGNVWTATPTAAAGPALIQTGSPTISMTLNRRSSAPTITYSSLRARLAPRQKCTPPPPKATWGFGDRRISKRNGSANTFLSRFAEG